MLKIQISVELRIIRWHDKQVITRKYHWLAFTIIVELHLAENWWFRKKKVIIAKCWSKILSKLWCQINNLSHLGDWCKIGRWRFVNGNCPFTFQLNFDCPFLNEKKIIKTQLLLLLLLLLRIILTSLKLW